MQRAAVNPDGTLNPAAFAKALQPYQKTLNGNGGMWFPQLKQKFATATAAQNTLDTMTAQRGLADSISGGDLRGADGVVTAQSFGDWLKANRSQLAKAQSPGAVLRLQQIANALKSTGGAAADALMTEVLPTTIGAATGGVEGGILGGMMHKGAAMLYSPLKTRANAAFNEAIERATLDPTYAQRLVAGLPTGPLSALDAARAFGRAIAKTSATPTLTTVGQSRSSSRMP